MPAAPPAPPAMPVMQPQPVQQAPAPVAPAPVPVAPAPMAPAPVAEPAPQRAHNPLDGPAAGGGGSGAPAKPRHGFL
jgi:hypothetical protein